MTNLVKVGNYAKDGNKFLNPKISKFTFHIFKRKAISPTKPTNFIVAKCEGVEKYISGMFPVSDSTYRIDYNREYYHITFTDDSVTVTKI